MSAPLNGSTPVNPNYVDPNRINHYIKDYRIPECKTVISPIVARVLNSQSEGTVPLAQAIPATAAGTSFPHTSYTYNNRGWQWGNNNYSLFSFNTTNNGPRPRRDSEEEKNKGPSPVLAGAFIGAVIAGSALVANTVSGYFIEKRKLSAIETDQALLENWNNNINRHLQENLSFLENSTVNSLVSHRECITQTYTLLNIEHDTQASKVNKAWGYSISSALTLVGSGLGLAGVFLAPELITVGVICLVAAACLAAGTYCWQVDTLAGQPEVNTSALRQSATALGLI